MKQDYPLNKVNIYETLPECLADIEQVYKDCPAITVYDSRLLQHTRTYSEFSKDVKAFAMMLIKRGLEGKHVAVAGENNYDWIVAFWAIGCIGGVAVVLDIEQGEEEILKMSLHADAEAVIAASDYEAIFSDFDYRQNQIILLEEWREEAKGADSTISFFRSAEAVKCSQPAVIVYTSGTVSVSKPVVLTHNNIMYNACHARELVDIGRKVFSPLPLFHTYSLVCGLLGTLSQGNHICVNGNLKTMMREMKQFEPDTLIAVPMIVDTLLRSIHLEQEKAGIRIVAREACAKYQSRKKWHLPAKSFRHETTCHMTGNALKLIISGGAHQNEQIAEEFGAYGIEVLQGYGITECSPLVSVNRKGQNKLGSVGRMLAGTQMKIEDGELLVKGPSVFEGYYKNRKLTEECLKDGWFHTGDIGYVDRKGYIYICGRKKNLIVFSNGKKVVPEELEQYIQAFPLVKEVMVYGASIGHAKDDVKLSAIIYTDIYQTRGMSSFAVLEQIQKEIDKLNQNLPLYKRIQSIKISETEFKKTSINKVKRGGITV